MVVLIFIIVGVVVCMAVFLSKKPSQKIHFADMSSELEELREHNRKWEEKFSVLMGYQGGGKELEKEGRLEEAAASYEKAIEYGKQHFKGNNFCHSYDRLMIVYRKLKRYDDEIRIIEDAIITLSEYNKENAERAIKENPNKRDEIENALQTCSRVYGNIRNPHNDGYLYCFIPHDIPKLEKRLQKAKDLQLKAK